MPMHNGLLPREGFTGDTITGFVRNTALNPALTLPLVLLALYTKKGENLSILHETAFKRLKYCLYLGLARMASSYLSEKSLNNFTTDEYDWEKEIVVVTGGAGGIGGNVVKLLAERNIKVVVLDIIPLTYEAPNNVYYFKCDITSPSTISSVAAEIRSLVGEPTVLINNAGVVRGKTIIDATERDIRFTFDVNTLAHYWLAKEFLPSMIAKNHGMVVTVASTASYVTVPDMTDYAASKAAALSFHEGLAAELRTRYNAPKVRTIVINQGYTKTPLFQGYQNDAKFMMPTLEPETVAEAIVKKVLTGNSGQVLIPGFSSALTLFKGMPHWYQNSVRMKGERIMKKWHGRQVVDLDKIAELKKEQSESDSTVLVKPHDE